MPPGAVQAARTATTLTHIRLRNARARRTGRRIRLRMGIACLIHPHAAEVIHSRSRHQRRADDRRQAGRGVRRAETLHARCVQSLSVQQCPDAGGSSRVTMALNRTLTPMLTRTRGACPAQARPHRRQPAAALRGREQRREPDPGPRDHHRTRGPARRRASLGIPTRRTTTCPPPGCQVAVVADRERPGLLARTSGSRSSTMRGSRCRTGSAGRSP